MANNTYSTTGNYTWTVLPGVTTITVELWGGGGGGSGGNATLAGCGGGGGAFAQLTNYSVTEGQTHNITVGNGGANGAANANGVNGTISIFRHSNNANAAYAAPGARGVRPAAGANSAGGTTGASSGNITYAGGNGANRNGTTGIYGGSGGGGGGFNGAGGAGANTLNAAGGGGGNGNGGNAGGNGGNAALNANGAGGVGNGTQPGGGGASGGASNKVGGRGGVGRIVITYTVNPRTINLFDATTIDDSVPIVQISGGAGPTRTINLFETTTISEGAGTAGTQYFGETSPESYSDSEESTVWFRNKDITYTCPGSGAYNLVELSAYIASISGGSNNIRLALYDTSNNRLYQGTSEVAVTSTSYGWVGHTGITGVQLQGGTNYRIACTIDGASLKIKYRSVTNGGHSYGFTDYTGGWPDPLADGTDDNYCKAIRAGVSGSGQLVKIAQLKPIISDSTSVTESRTVNLPSSGILTINKFETVTTDSTNRTVSIPVDFPLTSILDNFNRSAEGPPPGSGWTAPYGGIFGGWLTGSNICYSGSLANGYAMSAWNTTYGPDFEVYFTVNYQPATTTDIFINLMNDISNPATADGIGLALYRGSGSYISTITLATVTNGAIDTTIFQTDSDTPIVHVGDSVGVRRVGNNFYVYFKESGGSWYLLGTGSNSSYYTALYPVLTTNSSSSCEIDDFGGGTYSASLTINKFESVTTGSVNQTVKLPVLKIEKLESVTTDSTNRTVSVISAGNLTINRFETVTTNSLNATVNRNAATTRTINKFESVATDSTNRTVNRNNATTYTINKFESTSVTESRTATVTTETWSDHFTDQNARWEWGYHSGTGYQTCPTSIDGRTNTICEIGITDASSNTEYSDDSLHEDSISHDGNEYFSITLRCDVLGVGTKGWGLWDANAGAPDAVWFWYGSSSGDAYLRGFRAIVFNGGSPDFNQEITGIDITQWHDYRVIRNSGSAYFLIDNVVVAAYVGTMPSGNFRCEIWNDNAYIVSGTRYYEATGQYQRIYIDTASLDLPGYFPNYSINKSESATTDSTNRTVSISSATNLSINKFETVATDSTNRTVNRNNATTYSISKFETVSTDSLNRTVSIQEALDREPSRFDNVAVTEYRNVVIPALKINKYETAAITESRTIGAGGAVPLSVNKFETVGVEEIKSGSVTQANARLSIVNGTAFADFSNAGSLTPHIGKRLIIRDNAGKKLTGFIKAAGAGETYDSEMLWNTGFNDATNVVNWQSSIASVAGGVSGNCLEVTEDGTNYLGFGFQFNTEYIYSGLYKLVGYGKLGTADSYGMWLYQDGGDYHKIVGIDNLVNTDWQQFTWYGTNDSPTYDCTFACSVYYGSLVAGKTAYFDEVSLKQVLTPSVTGVTIVSTSGGATYNWESEETGFNRNDSGGYTYEIEDVVSVKLAQLKPIISDSTSITESRTVNRNSATNLSISKFETVTTDSLNLVLGDILTESFNATTGGSNHMTNATDSGHTDVSGWTGTVGAGSVLAPDNTDIADSAGGSTEILKIQKVSPNFAAWTRLTLPSEQAITYSQFYVYLASEGLSNTNALEFACARDASLRTTWNIRFYQNMTGQLVLTGGYYNNGGDVPLTSVNAATGQWYKIEVKYDNTNNSFQWKINENVIETFVLTGTKAAGINDIRFGSFAADATANTLYIDAVKISSIGYPLTSSQVKIAQLKPIISDSTTVTESKTVLLPTLKISKSESVTTDSTNRTVQITAAGGLSISKFETVGVEEIKSGSLTQANARLSIVNGTAFADFSSVGSLTPYIGKRLIVKDSTGKRLTGFIKAAGSGETYDSELLPNTTFENTDDITTWQASVASVGGGHTGNCLQVTITSNIGKGQHYLSSAQAGALYKFSAWGKNGTGNQYIAISNGDPLYNNLIQSWFGVDWELKTIYATPDISAAIFEYWVSWEVGRTGLFDDASSKQVLTPSVTGVTIVSTSGGSTYNWESEDSGFNRNDSSGYTYEIEDVVSVKLAQLKPIISDSTSVTESRTVTIQNATTYTVNKFESSSITESRTVNRNNATTYSINKFETTATNSLNVTVNRNAAATYSINKFESATTDSTNVSRRINPYFINKFDSTTVSEWWNILLPVAGQLYISKYEAVSVLEYLLPAIKRLFISSYDSTNIQESLSDVIKQLHVSKLDATSISEFIALAMSAVKINKFEAVTVLENIQQRLAQLKINKYDATTVAEAIVASIKQVKPNVFDQIGITESRTVQILAAGITSITAYDNVHLLESIVAKIAQLKPSIFDSTTVTEARVVNILSAGGIAASVYDTLALSEQIILVLKQLKPNVFDGVTVTESKVVQIVSAAARQASVYDAKTVTEYVNLLINQLKVSNVENVGVTELIVTAIKQLKPSIYETVGVSEFKQVKVHLKAIKFDSVHPTDAVFATVLAAGARSVSLSDTAVISELATVCIKILYQSLFDIVSVDDYSNVFTASPNLFRRLRLTYLGRYPDVVYTSRFPKVAFSPKYTIEVDTGRNPKVVFTPKHGETDITYY